MGDKNLNQALSCRYRLCIVIIDICLTFLMINSTQWCRKKSINTVRRENRLMTFITLRLKKIGYRIKIIIKWVKALIEFKTIRLCIYYFHFEYPFQSEFIHHPTSFLITYVVSMLITGNTDCTASIKYFTPTQSLDTEQLIVIGTYTK